MADPQDNKLPKAEQPILTQPMVSGQEPSIDNQAQTTTPDKQDPIQQTPPIPKSEPPPAPPIPETSATINIVPKTPEPLTAEPTTPPPLIPEDPMKISPEPENIESTQEKPFTTEEKPTPPPSPPIPPSSSPPPPPAPSALPPTPPDKGGPSFPTEDPQVAQPKRSNILKKIIKPFIVLSVIAALGFLIVKFVMPRLKNLNVRIPGQRVTLTYWGLWEPSSVVKSVFDEFEREHPDIKIEYEQQNHREYRERLQSAIARDEGPDIFRFHNTWVPMLRQELDPVPPEVFNATNFRQTFYPIAASDLISGANIVGIPLEIDGLALFYNKSIFQTAGKTPPTNWEDLRKTAFELTLRDQKKKIQTAGVALGTTNNVDHWPDILALMMLQNGTDLANPTDKLSSDALSFYTIFTRTDKVWDSTFPNSTEAFASEKVAMYFAPSWRILDVKALNPDLDFGVISVPQLPNSTITWASYWVEGVSSKSQSKAEAWELLKYLSTKETLEKLYTNAASQRAVGEPYSRVDMSELLKDDPLVGAYIQQAPSAKSWYMSSATHDNGINDRIIKYFEDAINSGASPQDALETASQGVSQVLSQYQAR